MSLSRLESTRSTAAWRISIWTTVAFTVGSALAFLIMYDFVAKGIYERSDAWLTGEVEVLAEVSAKAPRDSLYDRLMEEVAEHASHEVPEGKNAQNSVFFLLTRPGQEPVWVGPDLRASVQDTVEKKQLSKQRSFSIRVAGFPRPFRVVSHATGDGGTLYLGFADLAAASFLRRLTQRFLFIWFGMVVLGFAISSFGAYRTLSRVERITNTVSQIDSEDLSTRLPEGQHDDEITRLTRTFNRMLDRIQASVRQLRALTDSVAHDLKSPVTAIRGRLEVSLLEDDGSWHESVGRAIEDLDRLSQTLNTVLDLSEAEAGALRLSRDEVDLSKLLQQMSELYQPVFAERRFTLHSHLEPHAIVEADSSLLHRLFANLFDNELAHLPSQSEIWLTVRVGDRNAEVQIEDDGPGFPLEVKEHMFERFVKGVDSTGHGLGLAFVDAVVQAHKGSIHISNRDGNGARIAINIPLATVETIDSVA
jgi:signal transduction histidine kinase